MEWPASTYVEGGEDVLCDCALQTDLFRHYLLARIPEEYMRLSVADYCGDEVALAESMAYIDKWDGFKFHGIGLGYYSEKQGTGKTMLATLVARELIKIGERAFFINFRDIINLHDIPYDDKVTRDQQLRESTILVLDEVIPAYTLKQKDLFSEKLEELIRYRTNYNKVTIITTNMTPEKLEEEYPRTYSLLEAKENHIGVGGGDFRRKIWDLNKYLAENGERKAIS